MALNSSRRSNNNRSESIYREVGSGRFVSIRTINELEDVIDTSEAYMTDPTVIFNSDNTKVLFYYNTKDENEIEEMETLFKRTVKKGSTITLSDAPYLNELSGDDETYDISGTYKFIKYDSDTKTIIAEPITITKQSNTYLRYDSRYWMGSLLWTTADPITTRHTSYEIINFIGNESEHSFVSILGQIQKHDKIEVKGIGEFTVDSFRVDTDEGWERIVVKEQIPEKDLLGEMTYIRILRSDRNQPKEPVVGTIPTKKQQSKPLSSLTKTECENKSNTHWMGSSTTGFCMDGAEHPGKNSSYPITNPESEKTTVRSNSIQRNYILDESDIIKQVRTLNAETALGDRRTRQSGVNNPPTKECRNTCCSCWEAGPICWTTPCGVHCRDTAPPPVKPCAEIHNVGQRRNGCAGGFPCAFICENDGPEPMPTDPLCPCCIKDRISSTNYD